MYTIFLTIVLLYAGVRLLKAAHQIGLVETVKVALQATCLVILLILLAVKVTNTVVVH